MFGKPLPFAVMTIGLAILSCCATVAKEEPSANVKDYEYVRAQFADPDPVYGVNAWWWWLNGNVSEEAIDRDLKAMHDRKFQGVTIVDAGGQDQRGNRNVPAGPRFGSKEWNDLLVHALGVAREYGIEVGMNLMSGWNLGGPTITPEYAAKCLTYSEIKVSGGREVSVKIEQPKTVKGFYRDIAVLAVPIDEDRTSEPLDNLRYKFAFSEVGYSAKDCSYLLGNDPKSKKGAPAYVVAKEDVKNVSACMDSEGNFKWNAPAGEWGIIRMGFTCTGAVVSTSSETWPGLVLDYLSQKAFDYYWDGVVEPILTAASEYVGNTFKFLETDSWECGGMNWTDDFAEQFKDFNGYDILQYLPIVAGYVIDDLDASNAFAADFRKTVAHLVATNHYARFAERAHAHGMLIQPQCSGPHAAPLDGIMNYRYDDVPMSEFWARSPHRPTPDRRFFVKQASSAAHIYGKPVVGAEAFTTIGPHWNDLLWENQKPAFDHEICSGLNRVYFHTFTCSPPEMGIPGQQYFAGTHINPEVTWWDRSDAYIDYLRRLQMLSQCGRFRADALYYYGDHIPNIFINKFEDPAGVLPGYDYDVTDEEVLLKLKVRNGMVAVPGGLEYRVLAIPKNRVLSLDALKKLRSLLKSGATVIGSKPERMVSLDGSQEDFRKISDELWGAEPDAKGEKKCGKGTLIWGTTVNEYLAGHGVLPDFEVRNLSIRPGYDASKGNEDVLEASQGIDYIHYSLEDAELYFVTNQREAKVSFDAQFRVSGMKPEIWNALDGSVRPAGAYKMSDGVTSMPIVLEPCESTVIIFHEKTSSDGTETVNFPEYADVASLDGPWTVSFDPEWGGPDSPVTFRTLEDWTKNADAGIKYYSGKAVYRISFDFKPEASAEYCIELGDVKDVGFASVKINGRDKGTLWTCPFRVDVTDDIVSGRNTLEVEVINSWYNRVAGDEMGVSSKRFTKTNVVLGNDFQGRPLKEIELQPSGLLGPVKVRKIH